MITKTSEYVSTGHPDKVADFISEYILDRIIEIDPNVRYALEVQIKDYVVNLGGEITTCADVDDYDFEKWAREAVNKIGYTSEYAKNFGFDNTICGDRLEVNCYVSTQSPDIAQGVNRDAWGDQGIFFGFYCDESPDGDGIDHYLAKNLCQALYGMAKIGQGKVYGLDIKTQVTVSYIENKTPFVKEVIVAIPDQAGTEESRDAVKKMVDYFLTSAGAKKTKDYKCIVNGTGSYIKHSSVGDCGTTGRKLVVDFYGSNCRIGGGCVDSETEYLSENGWKKISEYDGGLVGQLNDNLELEMVKPGRYIDTYHDEVYEISTEKTTNMVLSGNHNVLYRTSKGHLQKKPLSQILEESEATKKGSHIDIPMTFSYDFKDGKVSVYDDSMSRIVVAHCADGTILKNGSKKWNCRIRVKKEYKIERIRKLFYNAGIEYEEREYSDGYRYFYYFLRNTSKLLCEQFQNPDKETAKMLSEEVYKWDGSEKYKEYRTTRKEDADFIQFVLSGVTGKAHSICVHKKKDGYKECYVVRETKKNYSNPFRKIGKNKIEKKEPQKMYCFTVPSGKLLLRRNGYIFCTANSPWTKDGTKADLTLNLYAHYLAKKEFEKGKGKYSCVETELSCCIGRPDVLVKIIYTLASDGSKLLKCEYTDIRPSSLIKEYKLDKPLYAERCMNGLFLEF